MSQEKVMWVLFFVATWKLRTTSWASASLRCRLVGIKCNACIHRHMLVKPASPVSAPHSRTAAVTVNNRGGKAAICIAKTSWIDSKLFYICKTV